MDETKHEHSGAVSHAHTHKNDLPDSIEIGVPSKSGAVKVYGNADDPEGWKKRIKAAMDVRKFAQREAELV